MCQSHVDFIGPAIARVMNGSDTMIDVIRRELEKVTYKKGYGFSVTQGYDDSAIRLHLVIPRIECVDGWSQFIDITFTKTFSYQEAFISGTDEMVRQLVYAWELHEADEWLKYDGKRVHEPHKERYG